MSDAAQWDYVSGVVNAKSLSDSNSVYTKWANDYDKDVKAINFVSSESMVKMSFDLIKNDESSLMLDIAAGTGLTTSAFKNAGFKGIADAIEINGAMLEVAKRKGLYRNAICKEVSSTEALPVPDNTYDFATVSGAFLGSHMPQGCIPHIISALKVGGLFIFNSRLADLNVEYQKSLWQILEGLVIEKKVALVKEVVAPLYEAVCPELGKPINARYSVYKKLQ